MSHNDSIAKALLLYRSGNHNEAETIWRNTLMICPVDNLSLRFNCLLRLASLYSSQKKTIESNIVAAQALSLLNGLPAQLPQKLLYAKDFLHSLVLTESSSSSSSSPYVDPNSVAQNYEVNKYIYSIDKLRDIGRNFTNSSDAFQSNNGDASDGKWRFDSRINKKSNSLSKKLIINASGSKRKIEANSNESCDA